MALLLVYAFNCFIGLTVLYCFIGLTVLLTKMFPVLVIVCLLAANWPWTCALRIQDAVREIGAQDRSHQGLAFPKGVEQRWGGGTDPVSCGYMRTHLDPQFPDFACFFLGLIPIILALSPFFLGLLRVKVHRQNIFIPSNIRHNVVVGYIDYTTHITYTFVLTNVTRITYINCTCYTQRLIYICTCIHTRSTSFTLQQVINLTFRTFYITWCTNIGMCIANTTLRRTYRQAFRH